MLNLQRYRVPLLGVEVTPLATNEFLISIDNAISEREKFFIAGHNLHSTYLYHSDVAFRDFYDRCSIVLLDGFPVWALLGSKRNSVSGSSGSTKLGSTDWIPQLDQLKNLKRVAVVGATISSNQKFLEILEQQIPGLRTLGIDGEQWINRPTGPIISQLRDFCPDLVLVGLGMPLQEHFLEANWDQLPDSIYAAVGGAIDQVSGHQKNAPRLIGKLGVEWVWRLLSQPSRLSHRYLVEPWKLAFLLIRNYAKNLG